MGTDLRTTPTTSGDLTTTRAGTGRTLSIIGFACAAVSLLFLPILFGPAAIVLGIIAYRKGDRLGMWAAVAGVVCMVAGMALGVWYFSNARDSAS
jgi:hypothetical protein